MQLNGAGRMVEKWYREIENKYPGKRCHEMMVMPNHIHCIIENTDDRTHELPPMMNIADTIITTINPERE